MRILYFDSADPEARWDNPNCRIGDPSVILEPGDPGYVPFVFPAVTVTLKPRTSRMKKGSAIKMKEAELAEQMLTFKNNIGAYATVLELDAATVAAQGADALYYEYTLKCATLMQNAAQQATAWKQLIRSGGTPPPTGAPVLPTLPASVPAVAPGVEQRFRKLVQDVKAHPAYNDPMGEALGIVGAVLTPPDLTTIRPEFELKLTGGQVFLDWGWQKYSGWLDGIELQVDRADGKGFVLLAQDTTPGYTDSAPFPATPTKWTYRAIFLLDDARVGQWSKPVTVLVG